MSQGLRLVHYKLAKNYAPDQTLERCEYAYHIVLLGGPQDLPQAFGLSLLNFYITSPVVPQVTDSVNRLSAVDSPNRKVVVQCESLAKQNHAVCSGSVGWVSDAGQLADYLGGYRSLWSELGLLNIPEREALQRFCDFFKVHAVLFVHTEGSVECVLALQNSTSPFISIERVENQYLSLAKEGERGELLEPESIRTRFQDLLMGDSLQVVGMSADQQRDELLRVYGELLASLTPALQAAKGRLPDACSKALSALSICESLSVDPTPLHALLEVLRP